MSEKKSYQSWTISDEFWKAIKGDIPKTERDPKKKYVHAPGQGRKPMPARKALEGIFYVLRTGANGKPCPGNMAVEAPYTGRFKSGWQRAFLRRSGPRVWNNTMNWKESAGSGKAWTVDMIKAPLALESVGKNPTDRGKNGDKTQCSDR